ncbi:MAG: hypothetical protein E7653_02130 [Ruminococcaceae bacterium]|nr:hypothetical protein [Oscillospiraceae bacterium]
MDVLNKVSTILTDLCGIEDISAEQELAKDLALDSLQMVTLLIMIEDNFNILLDEADMNPFDLITVEQVIKLVEKYVDGDGSEEKQD